MNIAQLGAVIKQARSASGLSQAELARLASISRATLNALESGKLSELGISKILNLLDIFGLQLQMSDIPGKPAFPDDAVMKIAKSANVSYRKTLSPAMLENSLCSGSMPQGFEAQLLYLIDEAPESMIMDAIREVARKNQIRPRKVWLNLLNMAEQVQSPRRLWNVRG